MFPVPPRRDAAPVRRYEPFWTRVAARRCFLQALIACGEDATVRPPPRCAVAHALANRHFTALHGRAGLPRSCGSVLAGMVTRFLDGRVQCLSGDGANTFAVSRNGAYVLMPTPFTDADGKLGNALSAVSTADGSLQFHVTSPGGPLWSDAAIANVFVGTDGRVYVLFHGVAHITMLSPEFKYLADVPVPGDAKRGVRACIASDRVLVTDTGDRGSPLVCAFIIENETECHQLRIALGAGVRTAAVRPCTGLCFLSDARRFAAATLTDLCVYALTGELLQTYSCGFRGPTVLACSPCDEIVAVSDGGYVAVVDPAGVVVQRFRARDVHGVRNVAVVNGVAFVKARVAYSSTALHKHLWPPVYCTLR